MSEQTDDDLELELERVTALYEKIPEEEFSPKVVEGIRQSAKRSVRRSPIDRLRQIVFGAEVGAVEQSGDRFRFVTAAVAFVAVTGLAGVLYIQGSTEVQPLLLTDDDRVSPLLIDAEEILAHFDKVVEMQPAVLPGEEDDERLKRIVQDLKVKKDTLSAAAELLESKKRSKDAENALNAVEILDDQIKKMEASPVD